jgi:phage pi2 protein 07
MLLGAHKKPCIGHTFHLFDLKNFVSGSSMLLSKPKYENIVKKFQKQWSMKNIVKKEKRERKHIEDT